MRLDLDPETRLRGARVQGVVTGGEMSPIPTSAVVALTHTIPAPPPPPPPAALSLAPLVPAKAPAAPLPPSPPVEPPTAEPPGAGPDPTVPSAPGCVLAADPPPSPPPPPLALSLAPLITETV